MALDETVSQSDLGHDAAHAELRAEAATRSVTIAQLTAGVSSKAEHAAVHTALHTNHNLIGAETTLPTGSLIGTSGHPAHHEALHKAYNLRTGGTLIFSDDFSSGNFDNWETCQWNAAGSIFNSDCSGYNGTSAYSAAVVNEGTAGHEACARFELRDGDIPFGGSERAEVSHPGPSTTDVVQGDIRRMEWDMKFASTFSIHASSGWCIPMQWHGSGPTSSPPLCLDINNAETIYLANNDASGYQRTAIGTITKNVWQRWRIDALFHPTTGWAALWIDGVSALTQHSRATMIPAESSNYLKMGLYRDPVNTATSVLWLDNVTIIEP